MRSFRTRVLFLLLILLAPAAATSKPARVTPTVWILKALREDLPRHIPKGIADEFGFTGSLRFENPLAPEELGQLADKGVTFAFDREGALDSVHRIGSIYPARISWKGFDEVLAFPGLLQVDCEYIRSPISPLNVTKPLTFSDELASQIEYATGKKPGEGVKIGDIDSAIDPLHPAFFYADGGYYPWIDVNDNGVFDFGTDVVDIDGDSLASASELTLYVDVAQVNFYDPEHGMDTLHGNGQFDLGVDWVYIDSNGNGKRDFGADAGFSDNSPGFGEPTFVVDDVDRDGVIDPEEKFVMLGNSKFEKILVAGKEYVRGDKLSEVSVRTFGTLDSSGRPVGLHGTGVNGILAGNTPGLNRFVGMAPYSTLYLMDNSLDYDTSWEDTSTIEKLVWAKAQGIDIMLYEFSMWGMTFMDGTSNLEVSMDQMYEENGVLQVVPAGNLATAGKHMEAALPTGDSEIGILLPESWPDYEYYPYQTPAYIFTLYFNGLPEDVSVAVKMPGSGEATPMPTNGSHEPILLGSGMDGMCYAETSAAGFTMLVCYIYDENQQAVASGKWKWTITNSRGTDLYVHGYIMDWVSSWNRVITFTDHESDDTTICHPSTANSAISVAAFGGRFGGPDELGFLRDYSSRGPRMDGDVAIDITAPDDPFTPLSEWDMSARMPGTESVTGSYMVFGGTSGAGPHVAGSLALLKQVLSDATAPEIRQRLLDGVDTNDAMGELPNPKYGYGKLNIYRSAMDQEPPQGNNPPTAGPTLVGRQGLYCFLDGSDSVDPDGDALEYRWDLNYDGKWDTPWSTESAIEYGYPEPMTAVMKLAVRDGWGKVGESLIVFDVNETTDMPEQTVEEPATNPDTMSTPDSISSDDTTLPDALADSQSGKDDLGDAPSSGGNGCAVGAEANNNTIPMLLLLAMLLMALPARFRRRT